MEARGAERREEKSVVWKWMQGTSFLVEGYGRGVDVKRNRSRVSGKKGIMRKRREGDEVRILGSLMVKREYVRNRI